MLLLAAFQFAGALALPAADGLLDVDRYATPTHVESQGSADCTPHHDHAFCQVVRATALAGPVRMATEVAAPPMVLRAAAPTGRGLFTPSVTRRSGAPGPRAPPSA